MKLAILAGLGSPWSYAAIEKIAQQGVEVHVIHVPPEPHQAYIDPQSPEWQARIAQLESRVKSRVQPPLGSGKLRYLGLGRWLRRYFETIQPDVVLSLYGGGLGLAAIRSGAPKVAIYVVGSDIHALKPLYTWVSRKTLAAAKLVIANGNALTEATRRLAPAARVETLLLGVDTDVFLPGAPSSITRFVTTRGFSPVYNNITILKALALLPEGLPEWEFTFVAGGDLLPELRTWAEQHLAPWQRERVHFRGGVAPESLVQELASTDVFVSMALSDGTSTSLLEALSCGLFPILSDIAPNRPWGEPGFMIAPQDPVALAKAMARLIEEPAIRQNSRDRLRSKIVGEADSKTNMKRLVEWLSSL